MDPQTLLPPSFAAINSFPLEILFVEALLLYKKPRKTLFVARALITVVACFLLNIGLYMLQLPDWLALSRFVIVFLLTLAGIRWCFHISVQEVLFQGVAAYALQYCSESIIYLVNIALGVDLFSQYPAAVSAEFPISALPLGLLFSWLFRRHEGERISDTALLCVSATVLAITMVISFAQWMYLPLDNRATRIICLVYAILCSLLSLVIQSGLLVQSRWRHEAELADRMLRLNQQQYELSRNTIDLINVKSHDLKKQINLLRNSSATMPTSQALDSIEQAVDHYDSLAKTGNPALDTILTDKLLSAQHQNVTLHYLVDGKAFGQLDAIDLYAIFGNILDNAFEAVAPLDSRLRVIDLKATRSGSMAVIRCSNYRAPSPSVLSTSICRRPPNRTRTGTDSVSPAFA
ncbi:GHKL domain-containing protein [Bifidobacterium lemurum]|uniref:GHKL domain-containing protein n=1 Tax=Bifidobacterium lemurum TaxID=1603886 RepID=UPI001867762B|nr:GHKL domain-containing protein [Bifidobacterium lemurum]QOL34811.1 GHKL domain-containing protein [Bifidobacterium lemurum]